MLAEFLRPSSYSQQGQRVVEGQRFMQAASDNFLGWARIGERDYNFRQLRDGKASADIDNASVTGLAHYARLCGWTLAHAHARTGDAVAIAGYLGAGETSDLAVASFAERYALTCALQLWNRFHGTGSMRGGSDKAYAPGRRQPGRRQ